MFRWLFPAIALALLSLPVCAQTFTATTYPAAPPASYTTKHDGFDSGWWQSSNHIGWWGWYAANRLVGRYHPPTARWQEWNGRAYIEGPAPWAPSPANLPGAKVERDGSVNMGLDTNRIGQSGERFLIGGNEVDPQEFAAHLRVSDAFKDDSQTSHITVIDPNDQRRAQTVQELTKQFGNKARINDYNPGAAGQNWATQPFKLDQDKRYQQSGHVTLVQGPADKDDKGNATGPAKVLGAHYATGPEMVQAIGRQVDPLYDPNKNGSGGGVSLNWKWLWDNLLYPLLLLLLGGGGTAGAMALRGKREKTEEKPASLGENIVAVLNQWKESQAARAKAAQEAEAEDAKVRAALLELAK